MGEQLMMVCVGDVSGLVRGKGIPVAARESRLVSGVGWTPTNVQITCFDTIADSPFGALGDLVLRPDPATEVQVDLGSDLPREHFILADIVQIDGTPWNCCLRSMLRSALADLESETGLSVLCAFEHEFMFRTASDPTHAYSLGGFRKRKHFGELFMGALRQAGLTPDSFLREFGDDQYEVTVEPAIGMASADHALIVREMARAAAAAIDEQVTFTPIRSLTGVGNGVHVHISLRDRNGEAATHDPAGPGELSAVAGSFVAGILKYLHAFIGLVAPSAVSYLRLTPHRWSAAFNNLGFRDREAAVRICPAFVTEGPAVARQMNVEFRAADAAANPHLVLATLVRAGLQGIRERLPTPQPTREDLSLLPPDALERLGLRRLPTSLEEALQALQSASVIGSWFPEGFLAVYVAHKRGELEALRGKAQDAILAAYADAY